MTFGCCSLSAFRAPNIHTNVGHRFNIGPIDVLGVILTRNLRASPCSLGTNTRVRHRVRLGLTRALDVQSNSRAANGAVLIELLHALA